MKDDRGSPVQDDIRAELEGNVRDAVRALADSMGCDSFVLPMLQAGGTQKVFLAFGSVEAIGRLLSPATSATPADGMQGRLDLPGIH